MDALTCKGRLRKCITCENTECQGICSEGNEAIIKLSKYESLKLEPEDIAKLAIDKEYWQREAVRMAAEIGEIRFKIAKLIECNLKN